MRLSKDDAIKALAIDISGRFPVGTKAVYVALGNLIRSLETAMELSITTGHDASVLMDYFVQKTAIQLKEELQL